MNHKNRRLWSCRAGFTLLELLMVVSVMVVVAGAAVLSLDKTGEYASLQVAQHDLATVAQAICRFSEDMGGPPQFIAELLQSPYSEVDPVDGSVTYPDGFGGWWWRDPNDPPVHLRKFNAATQSGWNGPYLRIHDDALFEQRIVSQDPDVPPEKITAELPEKKLAGLSSAIRDYACSLSGGSSYDNSPRLASSSFPDFGISLDRSIPQRLRLVMINAAGRVLDVNGNLWEPEGGTLSLTYNVGIPSTW